MPNQARRDADKRRRDNNPFRAWYKTAAWQKLRRAHLQQEPLCRMCAAEGRVNDGSRTADGAPQPNRHRRSPIVDHIEPHKGDWSKFTDPDNLQTLCSDDHDTTKAQQERRGYSNDIGEDGWPTDPSHPVLQG